jgi:hypothetical protein
MSVELYLQAKAEFELFEMEVQSAAALITAVGQALAEKPGRMIFSNVAEGLPMEASVSPDSESFSADHWKTAAQLQDLLARWHRVRNDMINAWNAIPSEMQVNLKGPDDFPGTDQGGLA